MKYRHCLHRAAAISAAVFFFIPRLAADPGAVFDRRADARRASAAYAELKSAGRTYLSLLESERLELAKAERDSAAAWAAMLCGQTGGAGHGEGGGQSQDGAVFLGVASSQKVFEDSRSRAFSLAAGIAGRRSGKAEGSEGKAAAALLQLRARSAKLSALFDSVPLKYLTLNSSAYAKAEAELLSLSPDLSSLFPEALLLGKKLKGAGREGKRLWLVCISAGDSEELAAAVLGSKKRILALLPSSQEGLSQLEAAFDAEQKLSAAGADMLFPSLRRSSLGPPLSALQALDAKRQDTLLAALSSGEHRLLDGAPVFQRFVSLVSALGPGGSCSSGLSGGCGRQADFAAAMGLSLPALARFAESAGRLKSAQKDESGGGTESGSASLSGPAALESSVLELNRIFASAARSSAAGRSSLGDYLVFLEKPWLAAFAAGQSRYAAPYAAARAALDGLLSEARTRAVRSLEADAAAGRLAAAAGRRAGEKGSPKVLVFESPEPGLSDCLAFVLEVQGSGGKTYLLPLPASISGPAYAAALSACLAGSSPQEGAGQGRGQASRPEPGEILSRFRIEVRGALPRGAGLASLAEEAYPSSLDAGGPESRLAALEAELLLEAQ